MIDILLVADVPWVVNDARAALSDGKHAISVVDDPRTVVEAVAASHPDVVVIDLQIGSMGGMAVTRAIRDAAAVGLGPRPALLLLLDRDADAFLAGRSGADAWLRKPFGSGELRGAIAAVAGEVTSV